ncbi:hypothetical protein [Pseudomonas chlororaphis]|uniref:hypothetical protein n=1 Tax=Pseudomonas chlororaphis TaxID=587753 RepID=UPI000F576B78|nr:hypothetical protein [Pseudomonas chlororaphis]
MKKYFAIAKAGISATSIEIGFDVTQLNVLVRQECQSSVSSRDGRPFLSVLALQCPRQFWCYAITMECPSARHPLKNLVLLKHTPSMFHGSNFAIHADRMLFSRQLIEKHFRTAVFEPISPFSMQNCILEFTFSKLTQALNTLIF